MITVTVDRPLSKFQEFCAKQIRICEEREKVHPVTYKCPKCKDKKCFTWWEGGYEYGKHCECFYQEHAEEIARRRQESAERKADLKRRQEEINK